MSEGDEIEMALDGSSDRMESFAEKLTKLKDSR